MITYEDDRSQTKVHVLLEGKRIGEIIASVAGGYRYRAKNGDIGEVFPTVVQVKRSLEPNA